MNTYTCPATTCCKCGDVIPVGEWFTRRGDTAICYACQPIHIDQAVDCQGRTQESVDGSERICAWCMVIGFLLFWALVVVWIAA